MDNPVYTLRHHTAPVLALAFLSSSKKAAAASKDAGLKLLVNE
jgi:hypothetical protein